jgi:hypothetical protein
MKELTKQLSWRTNQRVNSANSRIQCKLVIKESMPSSTTTAVHTPTTAAHQAGALRLERVVYAVVRHEDVLFGCTKLE